jgi:hypothetical protein
LVALLALIALTFHWYAGELPALFALAVNVTGVPAHTVVTGVEIVTLTSMTGLTVMQIWLEVAGFPVAQASVDVMLQTIQSPFNGV